MPGLVDLLALVVPPVLISLPAGSPQAASSGPLPSLPLELVHLILASWSPSEHGALDCREAYDARLVFYKSCALVHRSWTPLANRLLRRSLSLTTFLAGHLRTLEAQPLLAGVVRELSIDYGRDELAVDDKQLVAPILRSCKGVETLALAGVGWIAIEVLAELPNLRRLRLRNVGFDYQPEEGVPPPVLSALRYLSLEHISYASPSSALLPQIFPNLTALELVDSLPSYLAAFPSLHFLSLHDEWLAASYVSAASGGDVPVFPPYLEVLNISPSTLDQFLDLLAALEAHVALCHLRLDTTSFCHTPHRRPSIAGIRRLAAFLARPLAAGDETESAIPPCPLLDLEAVSIPSSLGLDGAYKDSLAALFNACESKGVEARYFAAADRLASEGRRRANAAVFNMPFWRMVEDVELGR
ncbi:hypothetical protein JCM10213_002350 [Rhodosporidiobolus nylandii]